MKESANTPVEGKLNENAADVKKSLPKTNYVDDKNGWVVFNNKRKKKVKLRAWVRMQAQELLFLDNFGNIGECRTKLIEVYNENGLGAIDKFVEDEYTREIGITLTEMRDLENIQHEE